MVLPPPVVILLVRILYGVAMTAVTETSIMFCMQVTISS